MAWGLGRGASSTLQGFFDILKITYCLVTANILLDFSRILIGSNPEQSRDNFVFF
jgi:hypothetical protein